MSSIERQYFMTIAEIEDAVLSQITNNTPDYNTLLNALTTASSAVQANYPGAALHYSYWTYQNLEGGWVGQIDICRGESSVLNHWDVAISVDLENSGGEYNAVVSTLVTMSYTQSSSSLGTFTPPVTSDGQ
jgi:hypothetical protein